MARIVRLHQTGGPEVLKIEEVEVPAPSKDEVKIRVKALGLNRAEALFRAGKYLAQPKFPARIGYEASGIVESVGPDVKELSPGDIVSVLPPPDMNRYGVYGEMALVPAQWVVKHPPSLDFVEAAAIWMQYLTAYGALIDIAKIAQGDYVIIPAASSSVGIAAIQLTNLNGATPIATTRTSQKKKLIEGVGAKHVIATQEENLVEKFRAITKEKGARVAFDPVGGKTVLALAEGMSDHGLLIEYGALSPEPTPFPLITAMRKGLSMRGYVLFELLNDTERLNRAIKYLSSALEKKTLKPVIAKTFKLDEIAEAHRYLESNQQFGKIVVTV